MHNFWLGTGIVLLALSQILGATTGLWFIPWLLALIAGGTIILTMAGVIVTAFLILGVIFTLAGLV